MYACTDASARAGGSPSHTSSTSRAFDTGLPWAATNAASNLRGSGPPSSTGPWPFAATIGPSTPTLSIRAA